ncbi:hypothetical protein BDY21DRAFT_284293 [Lineolata rhizophorae]|uniref:F-box domain-containing protein n=1 Tax=Lineolata rhizophorae TaxID=578093 RepID=A0A6A6P3B6_9PEZI|nr:hypothetical protein BDY21DRAFT_284293 [Lineolata rhizophorae]
MAPAHATNPQAESRLLRLPRELRDEIYAWLFSSTRLSSGTKSFRWGKRRMKPAPNSLALLRTCRQINHEVGHTWLRHVLFSFECPEAMLDKLSALPPETVSQIRHVRTGGMPLVLKPTFDEYDHIYELVWVLKLLPQLRLDTLTVLGPAYGDIAYETLEGLVRKGNGWKVLRYVVPNSTMLGFAEIARFRNEPPYRRGPQPGAWQSVLSGRDGDESDASVKVYRAVQPESSALNPKECCLFEQRIDPLDRSDKFGVKEDVGLMTPGEKRKELLVVVKRGHGVEIAEKDTPPYASPEIREWASGMSWAEISHRCIYYLQDEVENGEGFPYCLSYFKRQDHEVMFDKYSHVDEIEWGWQRKPHIRQIEPDLLLHIFGNELHGVP